MQRYTNFSDITAKFAKKAPSIQTLRCEIKVRDFAQELKNRTFQERYEILFFLSVLVAYLSQGLSAWSSYSAVSSVVAVKSTNHELVFGISCVLLGLIEVVKYVLVRVVFVSVYALSPVYPYPTIFLMLVWSSFSMYLSISGATELAKDTKQQKKIEIEQAGKEKELKAEIATIQNTDSHKSVVWNGGGQSSKVLTEVGKKLIAKREAELDSLRKSYQLKTQNFELAQTANIKRYNYFFGLFEVLYLFATAGAYYYKRTCAMEAHLLESTDTNPEVRATELVQTQVRTNKPAKVQTDLVRTDSTKRQYEPTVRTKQVEDSPEPIPELASEIVHEPANLPTESTPEPEPTESEWAELIERFTNGKRKYLEKYKEAVITILHLRKIEGQTQQIEKAVCQKHTVGRTTFYNILRIMDNTETK